MFLFTVPATVLYCIFFIYPIAIGIMYSFTDWNGLAKDFKFIGLANYIEAFTNKRFQNAVLFNIKFTILAVILVVGISLILALIFNSDIRLKSFFRGIFFFPAVLGMLVVGLIFNEIFYRVVPVIGKAMNISWLSTNILASKSTAMYGVLIVHVWLAVAMATVMLLAGLQSTPMELYEAAELDGANKWQQLCSVTLPLLRSTFTRCLFIAINWAMLLYDTNISLTNGNPFRTSEGITMNIYESAFRSNQMAYGAAKSVTFIVILVIISFAQVKLTSRKEVEL